MRRILRPDMRIHRVEQLDLALLGRLRIESLLLDVDCTLKPYREETLSEETVGWLDALRGGGIGLCIVSNGRGPRIGVLAEKYDLPFIAAAVKPLPRGCHAAMDKMGFDRRSTAIVGDQVFADIMAGNFAGIFTILVDPIHPEQEPWYTRLKRPLERLLVRGVVHQRPDTPPSSS